MEHANIAALMRGVAPVVHSEIEGVKAFIAERLAALAARVSTLEQATPLRGEKGDPGERGEKGDPGESIVGPPGPVGEIGPKGDSGIQGLPGKSIIVGKGPPTCDGYQGDVYLDAESGDLYELRSL